jgi:hypothetical protein
LAAKTSSGSGIALGAVLGLVLAGGIAATPFYLGRLQAEDVALDAALADDLETVRRAVLNVDAHLAVLKGLSDSKLAGASTTAEQAREFAGKPDLFSKDVLGDLEQTTRLLRDTIQRDKERGIEATAEARIAAGPPNAATAVNELSSKYVAAQERMLREAESAANRLRSTSRGSRSGNNHLGSNRIRAILEFSRGLLARNRADLERQQASLVRQAVESRLPALEEMRRLEQGLLAAAPARAQEVIDTQIEEVARRKDRAAAGLDALSKEVTNLEARAAGLEERAAQARAKLASPDGGRTDRPAYLEIAAEARRAEAEAAAIRQGTLDGARRIDAGPVNGGPPAYQGGEARPGLRDLNLHVAGLKQQVDLLERIAADLEQHKSTLASAADRIQAESEKARGQMEAQAAGLRGLMEQADAHLEAARSASDDALKAFASAGRLAKAAVTEAKKRTGDARQASAGTGPSAERLRRVSSDGDTEATLHCLAAECALLSAQVQAAMIGDAAEDLALRSRLAAATGGDRPAAAAETVEKLRTEALAHLAGAMTSYKEAANLISRTSATFAEGTVSGKNYLWQVQVAEAAAHLLQAQLVAASPEDAAEQRRLAYGLLKEAAQGKEQSPLLAPAIDALEYLQKTAAR